MADEPGQKAMLYFLEVLMNSNGPLTISQLAGRFGSRNFTTEMRTAAGGNEAGLKKFLLKYPSLFTVNGNMVCLCDGKNTGDSSQDHSPGSSTPSIRPLPDISNEIQAVQFFQLKLVKKEERWVPIKSLAGHLSQASAPVRECVGPQLEFSNWLLRHPHIFEVQGELVGLRDGIEAVATPAIPSRKLFNQTVDTTLAQTAKYIPPPPKTPPPAKKVPPKTPPTIRRSHSFSEKRAQALQAQSPVHPAASAAAEALLSPNTPGSRRRGAPVTMTANEYKAVMFLKDIIEKKGPLKMHNITGYFSQATEGVRNTIGWTKMELEDFLKKNASVFTLEDEVVCVVKNAKLNVIITGSRPQGQNIRTLSARKGKIFHVDKLWGIIDLGKHEHVFFDKSIMTCSIDNLQKDFKVGQLLCFNAVLAPKTSRAKWRATRVWTEFEQEPSDNESELSSSEMRSGMSPSLSIEDEINAFLPQRDIRDRDSFYRPDMPATIYTDAAPSAAGVVPIWNFEDEVAQAQPDGSNVSVVPESFQMNSAAAGVKIPVDPSSPAVNRRSAPSIMAEAGAAAVNGTITTVVMRRKPTSPILKKTTEVACQTVSTGDIIATQLYHENLENGH